MKILQQAIEIAKGAGKIILNHAEKGFTVKEKAKNDFVTNADTASEKFIIKEIKKLYPSHAIMAEESSFTDPTPLKSFLKSKYIWIIDPIDGTTNFAHQIPLYAVSIGIFKTKTAKTSKNYQYLSGEMVAGVVYAPKLNEIFWAEKDKGAFLNGKPISVSDTPKIEKALAVTGFPPIHKERNLPYFNAMVHKASAIRRLGAAALDLCYIAAGRFDIFWEFGLKPWDIAAASLIIEEAGGKVTDTNGNLADLFGGDLLATNSKLHKSIIETFDIV